MEIVKIRVEYRTEDFVRAFNFINNRSWWYRNSTFVIFASVFALVLFGIAALQDPSDNASVFMIWLVALIPAGFAGALIWILSKIFNPLYLKRSIQNQIRSSPLLQEANDIEFDREGISASTYLNSTKYKWEAFSEAIESDDDFHFLTSSKFTIFVPKSAFRNEAEMTIVRQFAKDKLFDRALLD
jgi:hypothetical protein